MRHCGLLAVAMLLVALPHLGWAQGRAILVVADNSDPSSIPEASPIFETAYGEIARKLSARGIAAMRATEIPAARKLGTRVSRDMDVALDAARAAGRPLAAVLAIRVYVSMHRSSKRNSFQLWIDGDALEIELGRLIAAHKHRGRKRHEVERSCGKDCMLEVAEDKIGEAAAEFAESMAGKLADALPR